MSQPRKPRNVTLPDAEYAFFRRLGGGNASAGMSKATVLLRGARADLLEHIDTLNEKAKIGARK